MQTKLGPSPVKLRAIALAIYEWASHDSQRPLDTLYGPDAKNCRAEIASLVHERNILKSEPIVQYGKLRESLILLAGVTGDCKASEDHALNAVLEEIIKEHLHELAVDVSMRNPCQDEGD